MFVVPYSSIKAFYEEYMSYSAFKHTHPDNFASLSTFQRAFTKLERQGIRKLNAKGSFNTCEICNNAEELLRNKSKLR